MRSTKALVVLCIVLMTGQAYIQNLNPYAKMNYFWAKSVGLEKREERNVRDIEGIEMTDAAPRHITRFVYFPSALPFARPMKFPLDN
ncbi:unnamed protein product [Bursaphelenchus xylophilus]|uniref:(pine wood nematode) hypothetical protein n=1 Tax=Bursaphelenchus xylophilus TaxID=6326 RepID=A0A1I7S5K8_BURXY|nr:unnamed protein product [Bursaphelenchus xylophilus]CAG9124818.1 unnamed protein product [Bursaphelenchus xylophilus]